MERCYQENAEYYYYRYFGYRFVRIDCWLRKLSARISIKKKLQKKNGTSQEDTFEYTWLFLKHPDSKTGFTGIILVGDAYVNEPNVE